MESTAMTAKQQVRICSNATATGTETKERSYLPLEGLRYTGISIEIPLSPLQTLKWGLGRSGAWLHPFQSLSCIALHAPELPGLTLPSQQVLNHWFKPSLSISATPSYLNRYTWQSTELRFTKMEWKYCQFIHHMFQAPFLLDWTCAQSSSWNLSPAQ